MFVEDEWVQMEEEDKQEEGETRAETGDGTGFKEAPGCSRRPVESTRLPGYPLGELQVGSEQRPASQQGGRVSPCEKDEGGVNKAKCGCVSCVLCVGGCDGVGV